MTIVVRSRRKKRETVDVTSKGPEPWATENWPANSGGTNNIAGGRILDPLSTSTGRFIRVLTRDLPFSVWKHPDEIGPIWSSQLLFLRELRTDIRRHYWR